VRANTEIVSSERHAGTVPPAETLPVVGFSPTMPPDAAGTRPDTGGIGAERDQHDPRGNRNGRTGR
jgi:hypothetical protein